MAGEQRPKTKVFYVDLLIGILIIADLIPMHVPMESH